MVTSAADCSCHHLTNLRKKLKFPGVLSNCKQIREFRNRKYCWTWWFKGFFRSWAKKYPYVVICHSDVTYNHPTNFGKKLKYQERTTKYTVHIHVITTKLPSQSRFAERNIVEWVNSSQINVVVTCTAYGSCDHLANLRKKLKFPGELSNSKQIGEFRNRKYCSTW